MLIILMLHPAENNHTSLKGFRPSVPCGWSNALLSEPTQGEGPEIYVSSNTFIGSMPWFPVIETHSELMRVICRQQQQALMT